MILTWKLDQYLNLTCETRKKVDDGALSTNYDTIVFFPIYGRFGAIWKPNSEYMVCISYIFIYNKQPFILEKLNAELKYSCTALILLLWLKVLLLPKKADFICKKMLTSAKSRGSSYEKVLFSETKYVCIYVPSFKFLA